MTNIKKCLLFIVFNNKKLFYNKNISLNSSYKK